MGRPMMAANSNTLCLRSSTFRAKSKSGRPAIDRIRRLIPALLQYNPTLTMRELAFTVMASRLMSI
jgi:hypothetical protein